MTGPGHNITADALGMDPEVFMKHHAAMSVARKDREAKAAILAAAKKEEKRVRKLYQADGGQQGDYDFAMKLRDDPQSVAIGRVRSITAMGQMTGGLPQAVQLSMFDDVMPDPAVEMAEHEGYMAGAGGDEIEKNPHDASVPQHQAWLTGYYRGRPYFEQALKDASAAEADQPDPMGDDDTDDTPDDPRGITTDEDAPPGFGEDERVEEPA